MSSLFVSLLEPWSKLKSFQSYVLIVWGFIEICCQIPCIWESSLAWSLVWHQALFMASHQLRVFYSAIRATQIFNHITASFDNLVYTHLRQNWVKFVLITEKFQFPVNSWPRQVRPTCLCADKNLSTETNLQRSRGPATNQDLIGTTNKKCFSWDKVVDRISLFRCDWVVQSAYTGMNSGFRSNVPVFGRSDTDNSYDQHNGYRPGQYFWSRYQNHDAQLQQFPQNTFVPTAGLTRFKHPSHPELVPASSSSLPAQTSPPAASPESADVEILVRPAKAQLCKNWRAG